MNGKMTLTLSTPSYPNMSLFHYNHAIHGRLTVSFRKAGSGDFLADRQGGFQEPKQRAAQSGIWLSRLCDYSILNCDSATRDTPVCIGGFPRKKAFVRITFSSLSDLTKRTLLRSLET